MCHSPCPWSAAEAASLCVAVAFSLAIVVGTAIGMAYAVRDLWKGGR